LSKIDLRSLMPQELENLVKELGEPKFRAKQIFAWLQMGVRSFDEMTNIPITLRQKLNEIGYLANAEVEAKFESKLDETVKFLFKMNDGLYVESVLMKYKHGYSICISTQIGCRMGCTFCASTVNGLDRSLTASEMLAQIMSAQNVCSVKISNIVLMGMGEPFDNYDNVLRFLHLVSHPDGLNIGMRHISLSTCGRVDGIEKLMKEKLQLTLSVSLHAPNDQIRSRTMPINKRWCVDELLASCRKYVDVTGRRISFEYAMIKDVNDSDECAFELADKLKGMICHVNLIPANEIRENDYVRSDMSRLNRFKSLLESKGINTTIRRTLGADISASCGQLRQTYNK